jgi:hypothetical protein
MNNLFYKNVKLTSILILSTFMIGQVQARKNAEQFKTEKVVNFEDGFYFEGPKDIKKNTMYFYADVFTPKKITENHPGMNELEIEDIDLRRNPHNIVAARALFIIASPNKEIDFEQFQRPKVLKEIYASEAVQSPSEFDTFNMSKSVVFSSVNYKIKIYNTYNKIVESSKYQQLLESSLRLDPRFGTYIGSVVHEQKEFTRMFSAGFMVANFYKVILNGKEKVYISAYSMTYPRVSAMKTLDKLLFWSNARSKLVDEIEDSLKKVSQIAQKLN